MGGFDNGALQGGIGTQAKRLGSILRGSGPPIPQAGVVGDLYMDTQTFFLYGKRTANEINPWGHHLFLVPAAYQNTLKWFAASAPTNDVGVTGDYCLLWGGFGSYGLQPSIYGPKQVSGWSENGEGPATQLDPAYAGFALPIGEADEGTPTAYSSSTQLIAVGAADEYILTYPVANAGGTPVSEVGVQSLPPQVAVTLNPIYTAEDEHAV